MVTKQSKMFPARNFGGTLNTADIVTPFTDYSQWERKSSRRALAKPKTGDRITLPGPVCAHGHVRKYPPGTSDGYIPPQSSLQGKPSSRILTKRPPRPRILEPSSIRLLKLQVAAARNSLTEYQQYQKELLSKNLSLITSIEETEDRSHTIVNELLEKYQKFKGALSSLQQRSTQEVEERRAELKQTRERLHKEIDDLREEVSQTKAMLQAKSRELQVLQHYREKEYPVKLVCVEQLREQTEMLTERNKVALLEVESHIAEEKEKCEQEMEEIRMRLQAQATEASIARMQRSVQEKAIQNKIMEKEILIHRQKYEDMKESIRILKSKISQLRHALKDQAYKRQPLQALGKCAPDMEMQLNIPVREHLPV